MEEVRKRIRQVLDKKGTTITAFAKSNGENQSKMSKQIKHDTAISMSTVLLLLKQYPDISAEWLLRGTGEMFLTEQPSHEERISRLERLVMDITTAS